MFVRDGGFVVLPDRADAAGVPALVPFRAPDVIEHPSGRPWLVGRWRQDEFTVADAGPVRVVVLGCCRIGAARLAELAGRVRGVADLDRLARVLPGSAHLIASVPGQVRVQGTLSLLRRVFTTRVAGVPVAGDRADVLAEMIGAEIDDESLAVRVVYQQASPPVSELSFWRGVDPVPPDTYLVLPDDGHAREVRWWRPPEPASPLAEAAPRVREALRVAVAQRGTGALAADLSGGMDSTSLTFLVAERDPHLTTFRIADADDDDAACSAQARRALPNARHVVVDQGELPAWYAPPYVLPDREAPHVLTRGLNRINHFLRSFADQGVSTRIVGDGGDELFTASATYLHTLVRRDPLTALRHLRVHRVMGGWPLSLTVASLTTRQDLGSWWRTTALGLTAPRSTQHRPTVGWGMPATAPAWATGDAVRSARRLLARVAEQAEPFSRDRGQHEVLAAVRRTGPGYRQLARRHTTSGLALELPFLDDRVIEAAISIRPHESFAPWRYKPLLAEAMRGIVPDVVLDRRTKADFGADSRRGLRGHLRDLVGAFEDSALAARGLIDVDALRARLTGPHPDIGAWVGLEATLGCEMWLRSLADSAERITDAPAP